MLNPSYIHGLEERHHVKVRKPNKSGSPKGNQINLRSIKAITLNTVWNQYFLFSNAVHGNGLRSEHVCSSEKGQLEFNMLKQPHQSLWPLFKAPEDVLYSWAAWWNKDHHLPKYSLWSKTGFIRLFPNKTKTWFSNQFQGFTLICCATYQTQCFRRLKRHKSVSEELQLERDTKFKAKSESFLCS